MTIEQLQAIHEAHAVHRVAADPDGGRLAKALGRNLLDDLRGERGRARHDADLAGPLAVRRHDADLAAPRHHDALRVDRKSTRLNPSHSCASRMPSSA